MVGSALCSFEHDRVLAGQKNSAQPLYAIRAPESALATPRGKSAQADHVTARRGHYRLIDVTRKREIVSPGVMFETNTPARIATFKTNTPARIATNLRHFAQCTRAAGRYLTSAAQGADANLGDARHANA